MVSEKKPQKYEIAKIHEFIDNVTIAPEGNTDSYTDTEQKLSHKTVFDSPTPAAQSLFQDPQKTNASVSNTIDEEGLPEFEPIPEDQGVSTENDDWLSSYDLLEIEPHWDTNQGHHKGVQRPESLPIEPTLYTEKHIKSAAEQDQQLRTDNRSEVKQRRKELLQKVKQERHEYLQQEKKARRLKRLEERLRKKDAHQ